ncbi:CDP-diacylglycerol--serine O-phosphatidyltransferase [Candidatus Woesearchaeota archaeon]|nr:CDP-diacylglycerol--serine O-phosphatidyltransferase [Candidatus Woesearchaeota archaeon]
MKIKKIKISKKGRPITFALFRIVLASILFFIILAEREDIIIYLFGLTAFLSFFEAFIYRKQKSQIRIIASVLGDKFLVNLTTIALVMIGAIPLWVMLVFLGRDVLTIVGGSYLFYKDIRREFTSSIIGKLTLFFQIISLIPVILGNVDWVLVWVAVIFTAVSAIEALIRSEFKLVRKSDTTELFKIHSLIKIADLFTLGNVIFGLVAIFFIIQNKYEYAIVCFFLAVIADFFDGKVARKLNQENVFGKELDSLADTISFGVAPAIFGFSLIQTPLAMVAFTIFLFCGVLRLAKYNIMHAKEGFEGMPITLNGIIIPIIYFSNVPTEFYPYIYIFLGVLMISTISFKKL